MGFVHQVSPPNAASTPRDNTPRQSSNLQHS
jgi:hypothetical protein